MAPFGHIKDLNAHLLHDHRRMGDGVGNHACGTCGVKFETLFQCRVHANGHVERERRVDGCEGREERTIGYFGGGKK